MLSGQVIQTSDIVPGNLGHYIGDKTMTSSEAIKEAGLDWDVALKPIQISIPHTFGRAQTIPTHRAVVRSDNNQVLGVVGNRYTPIQNSTAFKFMDGLVEDGSMQYHTVGNLKDGKKIWLLGQTGSFDVVPGDQVDKFLFLWNSHDGSSALRCIFTTIRVVCQNAVRAAFRNQIGDGVRVQHSRNIDTNLVSAKDILGFSQTNFKEFETFSKHMASKQINTAMLNALAQNLFPDPPPKVKQPSVEKNRNQIIRLFEEGQGNDAANVRGTAWAAFNAVSEYNNHYKVVRGSTKEERRFEYSLFGGGDTLIQKASNTLTRLAA